jgi:hypothetical protein
VGVSDESNSFAPEKVDDYDGDGLPDLAYCVWPNGESQPGQAMAVGYNAGNWYRLQKYVQALPDCTSAAT